jgi:RHS repeat-associated protein
VGNVNKITDAVNNSTTYVYDALDRLITDTNQLGKARTYSYDAVGNRTQTTDRNGRTVAYNYDTLNRQTSERWLNSNGTIKTFNTSYDAVGHLVSAISSDSSYSYTYDAVDRVTSINNTGTVGIPAVKFNYGYDAVGNLLTVNDSIKGVNAGVTGYSYDQLNRVTRLTQSGVGVQSKRVDMAYNAVNQLTGLSRFSGVNSVVDTSYVYDNNQRLIKLSHHQGASTVASYDYSYDPADKLNQTVSSSDGTSNYSYDSTNQLTGTDHTNQTDEAYQYDANGNRNSGGYVTGVNNQLLSDGIYNYTYDGEGNRTQRVEISTGKRTSYLWDYRNRLTTVLLSDPNGLVTKTIDYIYDGNNQRIGKRIDGAVTERYVIDRNQIALVFDGAGNQTHRYLYGTQIDQVLADETATGMVWALSDNQGTVKDLVDNSGVVVNHVTYDSFGQVVAQSNANVEFRYGYTGRDKDGETGLDYYRARYYDAGNGRFISEDPIGFEAGDSNLTRYVGNNAVNGTDPSGKEPVKDHATDVNTYIKFLNNTQTGFGNLRNQQAEDALFTLSRVNGTRTVNTAEISNAPVRYIYTERGGWIDMSHFLFYAGRALRYKRAFLGFRDPVVSCIQEGIAQEKILDQSTSGFSYEDLPSDRFGAEFGSNYFDKNSNKTFGEQLRNYLNNKLKAANPSSAPNWDKVPAENVRNRPLTWQNTTVIPMFTKPSGNGYWDSFDTK